ncbi:hypothetical protein [Palleronia sp.]|uniref:hypothetical protein n=1 Tax=Palleronia sp. TaxID=1940284 RepID=UPI0035C7C845
MTGSFSSVASIAAFSLLTGSATAQDKPVPIPKAVYAVGDTVPDGLKIAHSYAGLDLPPLTRDKCYTRTDEFIYTLDRKTREVLEVRPIADVLIW